MQRRGIPHSPADLHSHACINWRLQLDASAYRWEFEKRGKRIEVAVRWPVVTNHADIGVAAALRAFIDCMLDKDLRGEQRGLHAAD